MVTKEVIETTRLNLETKQTAFFYAYGDGGPVKGLQEMQCLEKSIEELRAALEAIPVLERTLLQE